MDRKLFVGMPFTAAVVFVAMLLCFLLAEGRAVGRGLIHASLLALISCGIYWLGAWGWVRSQRTHAVAETSASRSVRRTHWVLAVLSLVALLAVIVLPALHDVRVGMCSAGEAVSDVASGLLIVAAGVVPTVLGERIKRMNDTYYEKDRRIHRRRSERRQRFGDLP